MKVKCTQENLNRGLGIVSHVASKNTNLPILNNIMISAKDGILSLVATNLEIGVVANVRSKIDEDGSFTVPAAVIANYINLVSSDNIDIELDGKELEVKSGKQNTKIKGEGASEFPIIPEVEKNIEFKINGEELIKSVSQVVSSASMDDTRPEISGVFMYFNNLELTLAATDSYRLAEKKSKLITGKEEKKVIVPQRTIQELVRICGIHTPEEVIIHINDNQILFNLGDVKLSSRLIEGEYPDYKQIIPENFNTEAIIDKNEFIKVVKGASLFSKSGINDVNLAFLVEKGEISINALNTQLGENTASVSGKITGKDNDIVFNYKYLLDGLTNIDTQNVILKIIDNANPGIFMPEGKDDFAYIIMPIKQ